VTFLAPLFLSLAVLAGVPLLVHLLRRRVTRTVEFPAVRFLQQSQREHDRERLVRNRLLLLLRLLAVLALVAAVARPVANVGGAGHPPVALAVVLDASMSTRAIVDGRSVFARLQDAARAVVSQLGPEDRAWLLTSTGAIISGDAATLSAAIATLTPSSGRGDLDGALRRAQRLVANGAPRTPVIALLSDGQRSALPLSPAPLDLAETALIVHVPAVALPGNRAVLDVTTTPERWVPAGRVTARLQSDAPAPWRALLNERTIARGTASVAPDSLATSDVEIDAVATDTGWLAGRVELDPDDFPGDDTRHFAVRVAPATPVRADVSAGPFVRAALETLIDEGRLRPGAAGGAAVVSVVEATQSVIGPAVRLAPSNALQLVTANRALERAGIPWRFGAPLRDSVTVQDRAIDAPVRRALSDTEPAPGAQRASIDGATVTLRYRLTRTGATGDTGRVLLEAGGTPWVVAGRDYVLVASPLTPDATTAPLQGGFVPWLRDLISARLGDEGLLLRGAPGDTIASEGLVDSLQRRSGTATPVSGVALVVPDEPGVHTLRRLGRTVGVLVVNAPASESDVRAWGDSVWRESWMTGAPTFEPAPDRLAATVFDRAGGRSIVWPLVLLALGVLVLEALVARGLFAATTDAPSRATTRDAISPRG
jgi:hypothetical protein